MRCTCECKITILKETRAFKSMQFPEFQVTGPSEEHHRLRPGSTGLPDWEKPGPNCLGFPVRSRLQAVCPRLRSPDSPPACPGHQQPGLGSPPSHRPGTQGCLSCCPLGPEPKNRRQASPCPNHTLPGVSEALKPPSQALWLQGGGRALNSLLPRRPASHMGRLPPPAT